MIEKIKETKSEKLQFSMPTGDTADADKTPTAGPLMSKMTATVKELIADGKS